MELTPLRSFVAVAREGHVTRAARSLGLTQPAVSGQLARLEEELGTALFHRTPKGMELTSAGSAFLEHVERALADVDAGVAAVEALQGVQQGSLALGGGATATTYLLPPLLSSFHERFPNVRLYVREAGSRAVIDAVAAGELDLGVITVPEEPLPARLVHTPWIDDELALIVPDGHELSGRERFRWSELAGQPLVLFEAGSAVRRRIDRALERAGVVPQIVMELRSLESIQQMVAQGIGAAFVSRFALRDPTEGLVPTQYATELRRQLAVVRRRDRRPSPAARAFLEHLEG
jgi:DNA-binding transcriptional LysR family regulator